MKNLNSGKFLVLTAISMILASPSSYGYERPRFSNWNQDDQGWTSSTSMTDFNDNAISVSAKVAKLGAEMSAKCAAMQADALGFDQNEIIKRLYKMGAKSIAIEVGKPSTVAESGMTFDDEKKELKINLVGVVGKEFYTDTLRNCDAVRWDSPCGQEYTRSYQTIECPAYRREELTKQLIAVEQDLRVQRETKKAYEAGLAEGERRAQKTAEAGTSVQCSHVDSMSRDGQSQLQEVAQKALKKNSWSR